MSLRGIIDKSKGKAVPLQAWSGPEGSRKLKFPDFMTTAQGGGKVVSLTHRPPLPPGNAPGTHFCWRLSRPQGHSAIGRILCQWKFPMTPAGIEPATFRFVAQHLNHCATAVPKRYHSVTSIQILPIPKVETCKHPHKTSPVSKSPYSCEAVQAKPGIH